MILNYSQLIKEGRDKSARGKRRQLLDILTFVLRKADPYELAREALKGVSFEKYEKIFVIGAGKGAYRMALATEKILGKRLSGGWINVPQKIKDGVLKKIKITLAGHPFPNQGSLLGAKRILSLIKKASKDDLVLALFSGGASALFCLPVEGVTLADKIKINKLLLRSGAGINEMNIVRKHLSQVKGGQLATEVHQADLLALYLSDVVGDDLSAIASGPTVPDFSTFKQAIRILKKYRVWNHAPAAVRDYLEAGKRGDAPETLKKTLPNVKNILIGGHQTLVSAAQKKGRRLGYAVAALTDKMKGETKIIGPRLLEMANKKKKFVAKSGKFLAVAAGETTFKVRTKNPGGRNQQMALAILPYLKPGQSFLAFDTDGVDGVGPEKIGGILVDYPVLEAARQQNLDIKKAIRTNDSYRFFKKVGGQIKTGYVGTNLGDVVMILTSTKLKHE